MCLNRTPMSKVMVVWIGPEFPCSISSVSIYYVAESDIRLKCYDHWNFSRFFVIQFRVTWYIMGLNRTPMSKVIVDWAGPELPCSISSISIYHWPQLYTHVQSYCFLNWSRASMFNFERLGILCVWIGHPSEMLWPLQFLKHYHFSISSVSIYYGPQSYTHVKS